MNNNNNNKLKWVHAAGLAFYQSGPISNKKEHLRNLIIRRTKTQSHARAPNKTETLRSSPFVNAVTFPKCRSEVLSLPKIISRVFQ